MIKKASLRKIYRDIKRVKIQGASNIARAALNAYYLMPNNKNRKNLMSLRPTEPMLVNVLNLAGKIPKEKILKHFSESQDKINKNVFKIAKSGIKIFTHCHSTNVSKALIYSKKRGRRFQVYNTETRPLYQGRKTAKELSSKGIKVTTFVDSAMHQAIEKSDLILLGADAILKDGAINKIGSNANAEIAYVHKKSLYIVADSWKYSPKNVKIEERDFHEIWKDAPKRIKLRNPSFELIEKRYITGIISEFGILSFEKFLDKVNR